MTFLDRLSHKLHPTHMPLEKKVPVFFIYKMDKEYITRLIRSSSLSQVSDFYGILRQVGVEAGLWSMDYSPERRIKKMLVNKNIILSSYKEFEIPKKSGRGVRHICAPTGELKDILFCINIILQEKYTPAECCMGFTKCRSVVTNATVHTGQNYVYNIDLKNFFPSITYGQVYRALKYEPFIFDDSLAKTVAKLCCMKLVDNSGKAHYVLPQGAPTSPVLSNIVCSRLDDSLSRLSSRLNVKYTRYADDMTFSSEYDAYKSNGAFLEEVHRIITSQGFTINEEKTRLQKRGERQDVTGLVVSSKVNVKREYIKELRTLMYIWETYGYSEAVKRYACKHGISSTDGIPLISIIGGKIQYLKMVKGKQDSTYIRYQVRFDDLCGKSKPEKAYNESLVSTKIVG